MDEADWPTKMDVFIPTQLKGSVKKVCYLIEGLPTDGLRKGDTVTLNRFFRLVERRTWRTLGGIQDSWVIAPE